MAKFTRASDLERHLRKAMDSLQAETIKSVQAMIGSDAISPVDTGRFRSSWFAAEGTPSSEVAPEGTDYPNDDAKNLRVDSRKQYHLTNNLPYAHVIAIEGKTNPEKNTKSKPGTWFADFRNSWIPKLQAKAAALVKEQHDL